MCECCGQWFCPPECSNYEDHGMLRCYACGMRLFPGDDRYTANERAYCKDCMEHATIEDLVRICETDPEELLEQLGIRHGYGLSGKE